MKKTIINRINHIVLVLAVAAVSFGGSSGRYALVETGPMIRAPASCAQWELWRIELAAKRRQVREQIAYQDAFYRRPEFRWACSCYSCCFLMMCGNVWEWTESERSDGRTRFCIVRGGSFFKAEGSSWYADGGPQPCTFAAKFILMWPGLDRCATIGFRCAVDFADK